MWQYNIPNDEREVFHKYLRRNPCIFSTTEVADGFSTNGLQVVVDPASDLICSTICNALKDRVGLSVVRFGDGECNLIGFGRWSDTPTLDAYCIRALMAIQEDSIDDGECFSADLRKLMEQAVARADIVGVPGLWRPGAANIENTMDLFDKNPRGVAGYWRGIRVFLDLAKSGALDAKIVASAHLYIGVLRALDEIILMANEVVCVTNRARAVERLQKDFPRQTFRHISVGHHGGTDSLDFLQETEARLAHDMRGILALVGAGPWAEVYCTRVKERGGVGVDLGSGFDILAGLRTRPIHRRFVELGLLKTCV